MERKTNYISIHRSASIGDECVFYSKGKKYTYEEYSKSVRKKQLVKDVILITILSAVMLFRAYIFLEYGV